jgi:molecular chaperone GrpE
MPPRRHPARRRGAATESHDHRTRQRSRSVRRRRRARRRARRRRGAGRGRGAAAPPGAVPAVEAEPPSGAAAPESDPLAERVATLEAQLALAQEKARETFGRLKDEHERHLRAAADLENYKRRAQREKEEVQKFGIERLLRDLLPVVDNLDRALAAAPDGDPVAGGVRMVRKLFEEALGKNGVEVFSALGQPFDPRLHEALAQLDSPGAAPGTVVAEHARGFLLNGRLLRPALVAVASAPAAPVEAAPPEGTGE